MPRCKQTELKEPGTNMAFHQNSYGKELERERAALTLKIFIYGTPKEMKGFKRNLRLE